MNLQRAMEMKLAHVSLVIVIGKLTLSRAKKMMIIGGTDRGNVVPKKCSSWQKLLCDKLLRCGNILRIN